ncbi:MAG: PEP-CTERM sorting domain-containing protein [Planctomycetota bacterium]
MYSRAESLIHASLLALGISIVLAKSSTADEVVNIDFAADGDGRFIDYFSEAYAQINLDPDGMYSLVNDTPFGPVNAFPLEGGWLGVGEVMSNQTATRVGIESLSIDSASFDFQPFVDGLVLSLYDGTAGNGFYSTALSGVAGTVELNDGIVTNLNLTSNIAFEHLGALGTPYNGTLTITNNTFDLFVDDTENGIRQAWDFAGTASGTITAIPEPSSLASLCAMGATLILRRRRARSKKTDSAGLSVA